MTHSCTWRDSFMCVTWRIHVRDVTQSCAWRDSFMCVTWLIHVRDVTHDCFHMRAVTSTSICICDVNCDAFLCVMWLVRDAFICVTWIMTSFKRVTWPMTHAYVTRNTWVTVTLTASCSRHFQLGLPRETRESLWRLPAQDISWVMCVPWVIVTCNIHESRVCHDSLLCVIFMSVAPPGFLLISLVMCVPWLLVMCNVHDSLLCVTFMSVAPPSFLPTSSLCRSKRGGVGSSKTEGVGDWDGA